MIFVIVCVITWVLISIYIFVPGNISRRQSAFLYLVILDTNISTSWLIAEEFKWMILSKVVSQYLAFLVYRSVLSPFVILLFLRNIVGSGSVYQKMLNVLGMSVVILTLEQLLVHFRVETMVKWNIFYSLLYSFSVLVMSSFLLHWYRLHFKSYAGVPDETGTV